jgi:hypothetical protein
MGVLALRECCSSSCCRLLGVWVWCTWRCMRQSQGWWQGGSSSWQQSWSQVGEMEDCLLSRQRLGLLRWAHFDGMCNTSGLQSGCMTGCESIAVPEL